MRKLNLIILAILFCSCKNTDSKADIQGVWYTADPSLGDRHYSEAHITDTSFVVVNDASLSYLSSYKLKNDTLIQYVRDIHNNFQVIDTLNFIVMVTPDSLTMVNAFQPNQSTTWMRISNLDPINLLAEESLDPFIRDFRNRYENIYLKVHKPNSVDTNLKDFDVSWIQSK